MTHCENDNLVDEYFHQVSWELCKNCGFFTDGQFLNASHFFWFSLYVCIYVLLDNYPSTLIKKFIMIRLTRVAHKWAINYSPHMQQPAGCLAPLLLQDRMSFCQLANFIILIIKEMQLLHAIACPYLWNCSIY